MLDFYYVFFVAASDNVTGSRQPVGVHTKGCRSYSNIYIALDDNRPLLKCCADLSAALTTEKNRYDQVIGITWLW
ncbi:MAG: hypothetical protein U0930_05075 [Pirellulales bacterium]